MKNSLDFIFRFTYNIICKLIHGEALEPIPIVHNDIRSNKMATVKTPNFSTELTAEVVTRYKAGESVESIANFAGKSVRSIVAKLSREGVYVSKAKAKAEKRIPKAALVARIAELTGVNEEVLDSLEKATHEALEIVVNALEAGRPE